MRNSCRYFLVTSALLLILFSARSQVTERRSITLPSPVVSINSHVYKIANTCENGDVNLWSMKFAEEDNNPVVSFSSTGAFIASGNEKGYIKLWDQGNGELIKQFKKHEDQITCLDFSPDGSLIISGSKDRSLKIWDVESGELLHTLMGHSLKVNSVCFGPQGMKTASASDDGTVKIWNIQNGSLIHSFDNSNVSINSVAYSPDGNYIAAGDDMGNVRIWNVNEKKLYKTYSEHAGNVTSIVFHPNSMYLISGSTDRKIKIWNIKKKHSIQTIRAHENKINTLDLITDNNKKISYLLSGSDDKKLKVWNLSELPPRYEYLVNRYAREKIQQWQKKKKDETSEEYKKRVTEENRQEKFREFTQNAINRYALEKYDLKYDSLDNYDRFHETFRMKSDTLNPVIINVPPQEAQSFKDHFSSLELFEPRFSLTDDNDFVLSQLKIKNPDNQNVYIFDERNKNQFSTTELTLEAAPINITTEVAETEEILKEKLDKFTAKMHEEKKITDNVETSVNAKAVVEENEEGENELNFHIEYKYQVIKAMVENRTDDFPPGEYRFSTSNAARITLQVLRESLENELAEYLQNKKRVTVKITGSTDATPIAGTIPYDGDYGNFRYEPYYLNGNLESITVTEETGIKNNKQLAFLRTYGVRNFIDQYITILKNSKINYQHFAELSEKKGGEFRRIAVEVIIHNAFENNQPPDALFANKKTSDVDENIPVNDIEKPHTYALVIGNEDYSSYQKDLDKEANVDFAVHDAAIFKEYLEKTLGVPPRQIKLIKNATSGQIRQGLAWINNLARIEEGKADIIFYYSGHGLPHQETKDPYIVPVDVSGTNLEYAVKLQDIYDILAQYSTGKISMFIDACFSGGGKGGMLVKQKGVKIEPKENLLRGNNFVFTSSTGNEASYIYKDKYHGFFTYYLLKKLKETKGNISYEDLTEYVISNVQKETALEGKLQTPSIQTSEAIKEEWKSWRFR